MIVNWISKDKVGFSSPYYLLPIFSSSYDNDEQIGDLVWETERKVIVKYYDTVKNQYTLLKLRKS